MKTYKEFLAEKQNPTLQAIRRVVANELRNYRVEDSDIDSFIVTEPSSGSKARVGLRQRELYVERFPLRGTQSYFLCTNVEDVDNRKLIDAIHKAISTR